MALYRCATAGKDKTVKGSAVFVAIGDVGNCKQQLIDAGVWDNAGILNPSNWKGVLLTFNAPSVSGAGNIDISGQTNALSFSGGSYSPAVSQVSKTDSGLSFTMPSAPTFAVSIGPGAGPGEKYKSCPTSVSYAGYVFIIPND